MQKKVDCVIHFVEKCRYERDNIVMGQHDCFFVLLYSSPSITPEVYCHCLMLSKMLT